MILAVAVMCFANAGFAAESRLIDVGLWYGSTAASWTTLRSDTDFRVCVTRHRAGDIGLTKAIGFDGSKMYEFPLYDSAGNGVRTVTLTAYGAYVVVLKTFPSWSAGDYSPEEKASLLSDYHQWLEYYKSLGISPIFFYKFAPALGIPFDTYEAAEEYVRSSGLGESVADGNPCFLVKDANGEKIAVLSAENKDLMVMAGVTDLTCSESQKTYTYRGGFRYTLGSDGGFSCVNRVDIEDYLYGVVPVEMSASWHMESLKAQAIAARNYAVVPSGKYARYGFDVDDSVGSQAYSGYPAEHERSTAAVDATRGEYMMYDDEVIHMFFNASSGGYLDSNKNIWGGEELAYLRPKPDPYSLGFTWTFEMYPSFLSEVIADMGEAIGEPSGIEILSRTESGRVKRMRIFGTGGSFETSGERFKAYVDRRAFKSTLFTFDEMCKDNIFERSIDELLEAERSGVASGGGSSNASSEGNQSAGGGYEKLSKIIGGAVSKNPPRYVVAEGERNQNGTSAQTGGGGNTGSGFGSSSGGGSNAGSDRDSVQGAGGVSAAELYRLKLPENEQIYFLNDKITFYGHGYGHGIGLSQLGAVKMAEMGKNYREILEFYYHKVESVVR